MVILGRLHLLCCWSSWTTFDCLLCLCYVVVVYSERAPGNKKDEIHRSKKGLTRPSSSWSLFGPVDFGPIMWSTE